MNKSSLIGLSILTLIAALCVGSLFMAVERSPSEHAMTKPTQTHPATQTIPTGTAVISSRAYILEQIRQLVAEYDQAVQAEKQHGQVEFGTDPDTGEEIFLFKDESEQRIATLAMKLDEEIARLQQLYDQVYRDETSPTPFPTAASPGQARAYYQQLMDQSSKYCSIQRLTPENATVMVYDPAEGKYQPRIINDETARCDIYGKMLEEWRTAPQLAKVDQKADMALIRQIMGEPDLKLTFQSISSVPNAPGRSAALYTDETGAKYYVDVESARLAAIEPNFPGHPNIAPADTKSMDELRSIARQFAVTNSPRLAELESALLYGENCKVQICFFRWDYRNKDWTGTDWAMMPPFLQVGVLTNGQIVTYNNTLDLIAK